MKIDLNKLTRLNNWSLRAKVNLTVGLIFLFVITLVTSYTVKRENDRLLIIAEKQTKDLTTLYFDSLNTMMLTNTMDQRSILRNKMLAREEVVEARVIRGDPVIQQYGPGRADEIPLDSLDRKALLGEKISLIETLGNKRVWTVITPFRATENTRTVNCLQCHKVQSGSINGAIRVSFSLEDIDNAVSREMWISIIANLGFFTLGLVLVNLLLRSWIIGPLNNLMNVVTRRADGDITIRAPVQSQDEIGNLSHAFNNMINNVNSLAEREHASAVELHEKVDILLSVINKVTRGDYNVEIGFSGNDAIGELAYNLQIMITNIWNSIEEKKDAMDTLKNQVDQILEVVTKAAKGDLTGTIEFRGEDAISLLANGVQRMIENLNVLVAQVQKSSYQVSTSSTNIATTAKEQEATSVAQAETTSQISNTATKISTIAKELVNTMEQVAGISDDSAKLAVKGHEGLTLMQDTMSQVVNASGSIAEKLEILNEKANNINAVITTINKIADQTNLLSLNAAIEAEKAGEFGFGFSVVAKEIRRLADLTAVATLDIEQMVKEMQSAVAAGVMGIEKFSEQVKHSVNEVNLVGVQFKQIIELIQTLNPMFEEVNQNMHNQANGAEQINEAMSQLSDSAQQTVESLKQSNSSMEKLNAAAHDLQQGISKFKVKTT